MSAIKNLGNGKQAYRVDIGENIVVDNVNLTNTPETPLHVTGGVQLTGSYVRHSTALRPAGKEGDSLYLWDTGEALIHDGTDWREVV